jgi:transposase
MGVSTHPQEASVSEVTTIGLDIAKTVFHAHGADERGRGVFSKRLTRAKLLAFFAAQPRSRAAPWHWRRAAEPIIGPAS